MGCADFEPAGSDKYLNLVSHYDEETCGSTDHAVANGSCRVTFDLSFPKGADAGKSIKLRASKGTLTSSQGTVDGSEVTVTTAAQGDGGTQAGVAVLVAPLDAVTAQMTASAEDLLVSSDIDFKALLPMTLELTATVRTFKASSGRASDLTVGLSSALGSPTAGAKVHVASCCVPEGSAADPAAKEENCSRLLTVPSVLSTTAEHPETLAFEARLTAEADDYLAEPVKEADSFTIHVLASADGTITCPPPAPSALVDSVELRLVRDPPKD